MKCQILFSRKNKKNINLSSAESAHSMVSVKNVLIFPCYIVAVMIIASLFCHNIPVTGFGVLYIWCNNYTWHFKGYQVITL